MYPNFYADPNKNKQFANPLTNQMAIRAFIEQDMKARQAQQQAEQPKPIRGRGGFLSSIISELAGAGGATGGAALGASLGSVVPGVGTLIGGILGAGIGGFAGGTAGRGVENKVRDNQNFTGAGGSAKTAFGEGLLSGALGSLSTGVSAARGLKAVGGLKGLNAAAGGSDDALKAASKSLLTGGKKAGLAIADDGATNLGRLVSGSQRLESRALGFGQGEKLAGKPVTQRDITELFSVMNKEGIKSGHPDNVGRQVFNKLNKVGLQIDDALTRANRPLTKAEQAFLKKGFAREIGDDITMAGSPAAQRIASSLEKKFGSISSLDDLVKQRRFIQNKINFARNSANAVPGSEEVYLTAQRQLNRLAGSISPELKALNGRWAGLSKLEEATLNASRGLTAQSRSAMAGLMGGLKAGDTATALKATTGAAGRSIGGALDNLSGTTVGNVAKGTAVRGIANNMFKPGEPAPQEATQDLTEAIVTAPPQGVPMTQPTAPRLSLQDALAMAQQTLGPDATAPQYLSYAKAFMDEANSGSEGGDELDAVAKRQVASLDSAMAIVGQLKDLYDQAGGAQGFGGYVTKLTSKTPLNSQQKAYTDQRAAYVSRIVRALGEVGTLNEGDIQRAVALIPDYTDTPESAEMKWQGLMQVLDGTRQSIYSAGGGGSVQSNDLISALGAVQ